MKNKWDPKIAGADRYNEEIDKQEQYRLETNRHQENIAIAKEANRIAKQANNLAVKANKKSTISIILSIIEAIATLASLGLSIAAFINALT